MRKLFAFIGVVALGFIGAGVPTAGAGGDNTVVARGDFEFSPGDIRSDWEWHPDGASVKRGSILTIKDTVTPADLFGGGHTFTIVAAGDVPGSIKEVLEECFPDPSSPNPGCAAAAGHFETDPPTPVLNSGLPGINQPGDSLLIPGGGSNSARVTAPSGTTLRFICTFHPWMQGTLRVE
jgi:hypothetical protein